MDVYKCGFCLKWYLKTVDVTRDVKEWLWGMTEGRGSWGNNLFDLTSNTDQIILPEYFHSLLANTF